MLVLARKLVDRLRQPRTRADEVAELRRRFAAAPGPAVASAGEVEAARELASLRARMIAALGLVDACAGCARGHPLPHGRWDGGHCCGGTAAGVFGDDEVAALRLSGTTPASLVAPRGDHAGCSFRGPTGCSLDPAHRPNLCVRYLCRELEAELRARGDLPAIKAIGASMSAELARFSRARAARLLAGADPEAP